MWLERSELLLGKEGLERLKNANILVVGVGGVGAYAAEMLVRAGVGSMTIADSDSVSESNINRQLIALHSTVGRVKTEVLAERLKDINPELNLTIVSEYIKDEKTDEILDSTKFDYIVDAIDTLSPKLALIKGALDRNIPLVSSMGAGAKLDPTKMEICDISKTHHCPLAHMLRKRLHKIGIKRGFHAVFSPEPVREGAMILCEEQNKKSNVGTISYIPVLLQIGFLEYVVQRIRETGISDTRKIQLWPECTYDKMNGYARAFRRFFERFNRRYITQNPKRTCYSLRHNFIDNLKQSEIPENVVSEIAGHSNGNITYRRYGKTLKATVKLDAMKKLDFGFDIFELTGISPKTDDEISTAAIFVRERNSKDRYRVHKTVGL